MQGVIASWFGVQGLMYNFSLNPITLDMTEVLTIFCNFLQHIDIMISKYVHYNIVLVYYNIMCSV